MSLDITIIINNNSYMISDVLLQISMKSLSWKSSYHQFLLFKFFSMEFLKIQNFSNKPMSNTEEIEPANVFW